MKRSDPTACRVCDRPHQHMVWAVGFWPDGTCAACFNWAMTEIRAAYGLLNPSGPRVQASADRRSA